MVMLNWGEAVKMNRPLPCGDRIFIEGNYIVHEVCKLGDFIDHDAANLVADYATFVRQQQSMRGPIDPVSRNWKEYCADDKIHESRLGPRWTMPFCYFGIRHKSCFNGLRGLDVGCNVLARSLRLYSDRFMSRMRETGEYAYEYEQFIPHYEYYRNWRCEMRGIDLYPSSSKPMISKGDLRMIDSPADSINFFTIAMIIGPSNSASTILDAAMCISELYRTASTDSLVYIADFVITPAVVLLSIEMGFRVFANNSYQTGIPIGMFLVKKDMDSRVSRFFSIIRGLESSEIILDEGKEIEIVNRELLRLYSPASEKIDLGMGNRDCLIALDPDIKAGSPNRVRDGN